MPRPLRIEYNGRSQSVSAWARETGIPDNLIRTRLRIGWGLDEIFSTPRGVSRIKRPAGPSGPLIEYHGKYRTLSEWAREVGLSPSVISGRLKLGWPIAETLTKPVRVRNPNGAGYKRKDMRSYRIPSKRPGFRPKPSDSCCELCKRPVESLHADHDPMTERFRGWLCFHCNTGLGKLGDNMSGVQAALDYLKSR